MYEIGDVVIDRTYNKNGVLAIVVGTGIQQPILLYHNKGIFCDELGDGFSTWDGLEMVGHIDFEKVWKEAVRIADRKTEQSIDIIRCKDCDNYAGEGMYCAWNVLTGDMGYCHHARPKGSTDITAEQTEPTWSKMEQVDKDINVRSKDEPQIDCGACKHSRITCRYMERGEPCLYEPKDEPQTERKE